MCLILYWYCEEKFCVGRRVKDQRNPSPNYTWKFERLLFLRAVILIFYWIYGDSASSLPQSSLTVIKTVWVNLRWRVEVKDKDELKNWIKAPVKMCLISFRFSVKGWSHTSGNASVPVLIEARPQSAVNLSGGIIHSYSFIDFFFDEPEFQAQREIWCRGAIRPPPLPKLPSRFDVNLERVTSESTRVWSVQVVTRVIISKEKDNRLSHDVVTSDVWRRLVVCSRNVANHIRSDHIVRQTILLHT